jgi:hypothetical protein
MLQNLQQHKELTQVISRDENTPELGQFWARRYLEIMEKELFVVDSRFENVVSEEFENFVTIPAGQIILCNHLDKENRLDEDLLVSTIETSIRLLDALVTYMGKYKNNLELAQKRIISVGIDDLDEFFERYNSNANDEDREYIAQLVGETAYRASEFIAEEKGPFEIYNDIKYDIGDNYFDTWVDERDNIISNQEIQNSKNEIQAGQYSLLPRRNLGILNFAVEKKWLKYSDEAKITQALRDLEVTKKPSESSKPFNIKMNTDSFAQTRPSITSQNRVNNHVDEIFEHLLKERTGLTNLSSEPDQVELPISEPVIQKVEEVVKEISTPISTVKPDTSNAKDIRLYILIEFDNKIVFAKDNNRLGLPFVSLDDNTNIEKAIWEGVLKKYNLLIDLDKEFTVLFDPLKQNNIINIGYLAHLQNHTLPNDLFWAAPENEDFIDDTSFRILKRYKKQPQAVTTNLDLKSDGQYEQVKLPQPIQREYTVQPQPQILSTIQPTYPKASEKIEYKGFKKPNQANLIYSLRLEQKINTKTFGAVFITFEYTQKMPQITGFRCDKLSENDKHALDVILNLINLLLSNNYTLELIEEYLEKKVRKDETNNINNFITVFVFCMREVPANLNELIQLLKE